MKLFKIFKGRFAIVYSYILVYLLLAFIIRSVFYVLSISAIEFSIGTLIRIFTTGLFFDFGVAVFFIFIYALYVFLFPKRFIGGKIDKLISYFILSITFFITFFSFLGEIPFWEEFNTRYNFIAVDYLIYTYEVVENINQSYPLPLLIIGLLALCFGLFYMLKKKGKTQASFQDKMPFKTRFVYFIPLVLIPFIYISFVTNKQAEFSKNTYVNELSKNGVYSMFAAYRSNELDFNTFYATLDTKKSFNIIKEELKQSNQNYLKNDMRLLRSNKGDSIESKPNIVLICIESFNADFMNTFGSKKNLTPNIDQLASQSVLFTNMYATGTRTVRGMEAITLSVPPTPGHSIVRRPNNANLYSIGSIFKQKDYQLNFFYGGDGYFDNMNSFFGGQGFNIIDRNRGNPLSDAIKTTRTNIEDNEVTFENAWGICDEDAYNKLIQIQDKNFSEGKKSFSFLMTTSNHRPYSFPENKIQLKQGTRNAAVNYTDFAMGQFFKTAKTKPWFKNTVFVIIADHCASSAGKWDITINKHHIPAMIYNLPNVQATKIDKLCSQIDIVPTVLGYLGWNFNTAIYGKDINKTPKEKERALIGNYRTVGLLKRNIFTELNDRKKTNQYTWDFTKKEMSLLKNEDATSKELTISYYQTASHRYKNGLMKE